MQYEKLIDTVAEVALRVPSPVWDDTVDYYRDMIGLQIVEQGADAVLLRAKRDRFHHTIALVRSDDAGMERAVWKVPTVEDLDVIRGRLAAMDLEVREVRGDEIPGVGKAIATRDFGGHHTVFAAEVEQTPLRPEPYRGVSVHFLDHLNLNYDTGLDDARRLYVDALGFKVTDTASVDGNVIGYWLRCSHLHHDVAIMVGGNFMHHVAFRSVSPDDVRRASDQFADLRYPIDHGPAAHSPMGMYFLYVKDPAGNRNEIFVDEVRRWTDWEPGAYEDTAEGDFELTRLLARYGPVPQPEFYVTGT